MAVIEVHHVEEKKLPSQSIFLSWDENCDAIIRKVNARMQLIRGLQSFGATSQEMVHFWILFCRSILEQSCVVWGPSLTQENIEDLERTQKSFALPK